jgi:hypothetical protein
MAYKPVNFPLDKRLEPVGEDPIVPNSVGHFRGGSPPCVLRGVVRHDQCLPIARAYRPER